MSFIAKRRGSGSEPTLPLINIVFLMLIFFLVAAQVARPLDADLSLVQTDDPNVIPPGDALVLHKDGSLTWRGAETTLEAGLQAMSAERETGQVRILPDRDAPAHALLKIARAAHATGGTEKVLIITEQALQ
jgi:biopolymer transport protein ExbD